MKLQLLCLTLYTIFDICIQQKLYENTLNNVTQIARVNEKLALSYIPSDEVLYVSMQAVDTQSDSQMSFWKKRQMQQFCKAKNRGIQENLEEYQVIQVGLNQKIKSTLMHNMKVYILLDDLTILHYDMQSSTNLQDVHVSVDNFYKDSSLQRAKRVNNNCDGLILDRQLNRVYVYSKDRLYLLEESFDETQKTYKITNVSGNNLIVRNTTYKAAIQGSILLTANGVDGIDLYSSSHQTPLFTVKTNYNSSSLGIPSLVDIRDIVLVQDYLYVLCKENGVNVYHFDYDKQQLGPVLASIPMKGGYKVSLNPDNKLMFVLGQSTNGTYWVKEIVLSSYESTFNYIQNREYIEKTPYYDVQYATNFVLIVGENIHRVLFHMTSRDIVADEESVSGFLIQKDVNYISLFSAHNTYFMLLVNKYMIRISKVTQVHAGVECLADSSYPLGEYSYQVDVTTRNCQPKAANNDISPLSACHQRHYVNVTLFSGFSYDDKKWLAFLITGLIMALVLLFLCLFNRYRRWSSQRIQKLQTECDQIKNIKYQKMNISNDTNQDNHEQLTLEISQNN